MDKIEKKFKNNRLGLIFAAMILIFLAMLRICGVMTNKKQDVINLYENINDTLVTIKNKDSTETSKIALLQAENVKLFLSIKSKDETIIQLQKEVKKNKEQLKNGGSVSIVTVTTTYSSSAKSKDSIVDNRQNFLASNKDTTWIKWNTIANKDSTTLNIKVKNAYTVVIGKEKIGMFKYKPIVEITNKNPYTSTQALRAFEVKDLREERFSIGLQVGYGITFKGLSPYLGIGFGVKIIEW